MIRRGLIMALVFLCAFLSQSLSSAISIHHYEDLPENFYGTDNGVAIMNWSDNTIFNLFIKNQIDETASYCITFSNIETHWKISAEPSSGLIPPKSSAEVKINLSSPSEDMGPGWTWITGNIKMEYPNSPSSEGHFPIIGIVRKSNDRPTVRLVAPGGGAKFEVTLKNSHDEEVYYDAYAEIAARCLGDTTKWIIDISERAGYISPNTDKKVILNITSSPSAFDDTWILVRFKVIDNYEINSIYFLVVVKKVYSVKLMCEDNDKIGISGDSINYTLKVKNTGTMHDTYSITRSSPHGNWIVKLYKEQISLSAGEESYFKISIMIPSDAKKNETCEIKIRVQSVNKASSQSEVVLRCTANPPYYLKIVLDTSEKMTNPGEKAIFSIKIWNKGFMNDNVSIYSTPPPIGWSSDISEENINISAGHYETVELSITPPNKALPSSTCTVSIFVISSGNSKIKASAKATVIVSQVHNLTINIDKNYTKVDPGKSVDVLIKIFNNGNGVESVDISVDSSPPKWKILLEKEHVEIAPYAERTVKCTISVPYKEKSINETVSFLLKNSWMKEYVYITVKVLPRYLVEIICIDETHTVFPGMSTTYNLTIYNRGNAKDNISFEVVNEYWLGWRAELSLKNVTLMPNEYTNLILTIYSPSNAPAEQEYSCTVLAKSSTGKSSSVDIITIAMGYTNFTFSSSDRLLQAYPGDIIHTALNLKNTGNREISVEIVFSTPSPAWWVEIEKDVSLDVNESKSRECMIYVPNKCVVGEYNISLRASSDKIEYNIFISIIILPVHNISIDIDNKYSAERNIPIEITIKINNNGNIEEQIEIDVSGSASYFLKEKKLTKRVAAYSREYVKLIAVFPTYLEGGEYYLKVKIKGESISDIYTIKINLGYIQQKVSVGDTFCYIQFSLALIITMLILLIIAVRKYGYL